MEVYGNGGFSKHYDVPAQETVSTVGAGDNFNAGFVFGLIKNDISLSQLQDGLTAQQWDDTVRYALAFSADCCKDIYNYVSKDFGEKMRG